MLSDRINKVEKARQYILEAERFTIYGDRATVRGDHGSYALARHHEAWVCNCDFCQRNGWCAHTLAIEWYLGERPRISSN